MSSNLRSLLGIPRVQKKKKAAAKARYHEADDASSFSSWTSSLPRTKPSSVTPFTKSTSVQAEPSHSHPHPRFPYTSVPQPPPLPPPTSSSSSTRSTSTSNSKAPLTIPQAHVQIRARMFDRIPDRGSGLGGSVKTASVLQTRASMPPVLSTAHLHAAVGRTPTAVEREAAELVRAGVARRIVLPERRRRGGSRRERGGGVVEGELLVLMRDLERMVRGGDGGESVGEKGSSGGLDRETRFKFVEWLRAHPGAQVMREGEEGLERPQIDALVRAGFLTAVLGDGSGTGRGVYARPEDRSTMLSLEAVSRAAAGTIAAVGGENALHSAGGTGGARGGDGSPPGSGTSSTMWCFSVAVPGTGVFLKLVSGALERLEELLERAQYREMTEDDLREKWDGGIAGDREAALAKKARGEFVGILPGRTKKWKDFAGLSFGFVLHEAIGAGLVEVFDTGSVGRGVRLLV